MRICILSACTGAKAVKAPLALTAQDFQQGPAVVAEKEQAVAELMRPAVDMYTGTQHVRVKNSLQALLASGTADGESVCADFWILSAGYGLIPASRRIAPYDCSFNALPTKAMSESKQRPRRAPPTLVRRWAAALDVPGAVRRALGAPYDLGFILLGASYLGVCDLDTEVRLGGPTLLFCGNGAATQLPRLSELRVIALGPSDTTRFSCGQVGLKGELARRVFVLLRTQPGAFHCLIDERRPVLDLLARV